jgi:hypothetical protein
MAQAENSEAILKGGNKKVEKETWEEKRERETKECEAFQGIIQGVAPLLTINGNWSYEPSTNGKETCYLIGRGDAKIWVKLNQWIKPNRIVLSSFYPNYRGQVSYKHFEITVSANKEPAKIARDIENRLLPDYLPELERVIERIKRTKEYEENKANQIKMIADHFGLEVHENGNIYPRWDSIRSIKSYSEDKVQFEIECSAELAIKMLDLL